MDKNVLVNHPTNHTKQQKSLTGTLRNSFFVFCHYGIMWRDMAWRDMAWRGVVWYGMVWYGMVWYGVVWCGVVPYRRALHLVHQLPFLFCFCCSEFK